MGEMSISRNGVHFALYWYSIYKCTSASVIRGIVVVILPTIFWYRGRQHSLSRSATAPVFLSPVDSGISLFRCISIPDYSIPEYLYSGLSPFRIISIPEYLYSGLSLFRIISILEYLYSGLSLFQIISIPEHLYSGLSLFGLSLFRSISIPYFY